MSCQEEEEVKSEDQIFRFGALSRSSNPCAHSPPLFFFVSWESELQASEVSSDGYLQFLFVVPFEVKSITAYVQTDFAHLTPKVGLTLVKA